ncbi:lysylphosphatidylglycerol synthase domain-containing protein [Agromyces sp. SYSU T00266]|uniref:lysylphosphatidylglycerol synthase domain-containing protein n=1 Tax=Agromyces zhanjiangensis TaxID=3158562 RepID=UPI00339B4307
MAKLPPGARRALRYSITAIVVIVVGVLFARALSANWEEFVAQDLEFDWLWVIAVLLFAVAVPLSGLLWGQIVNRLSHGHRVTPREAMAVQCASWLLKYVPGQVGAVVNKVAWGSARGLSRTLIVITFIYENVFLQIASIVPSAVIILLALGSDVFAENPVTLLLPLLMLVPLVAVLVPDVFHRVLSLATRRVLKQDLPQEYFLPTRTTLGYLVEFLGPRILNGAGFVVIAVSIAQPPPSQWLLFGAAYVLAGAIGILAVFVPSGLGVREAVIFAVLVAAGVPAATAAVLSILSRLLSTIADGAVALLYVALRVPGPKDTPSS